MIAHLVHTSNCKDGDKVKNATGDILQPFPGNLVAWYSIAGLIEYAVAGAIVGTIYKTGPAMPV
jgi:hypothetical protein